MRHSLMTSNIVHSDSPLVATRLEQLCLNETVLCEAISQAHSYRARLTQNHPKNYPGLVMYGECVAALRNLLRPLGWHNPKVGTYELTVNSSLRLAIAVASGDEATGMPYGTPSNRSPKGRNTIEAIEINQQLDMFVEVIPDTLPDYSDHQTWVLLHHTDIARKEIRIELSHPAVIGEDGKIRAWYERIIIGSISLDDAQVTTIPSGPDIDFDVRRKAS